MAKKLEFDELHIFELEEKVTNLYISLEHLKGRKKREEMCDRFLDWFITAYLLGMYEAGYDLEYTAEPDSGKMFEAIYRMIAGKTFEDRVGEYVDADDLPGLIKVAETEFHRIFNEGGYDAATQAEQHGIQSMKTWVTMRDDKVRDTHWGIEGVSVPKDELFYTSDGDSALVPGGFSNPENNINCRCILRYSRQ